MNREFAALMAQIIPVVMLALVLQAQGRLAALRRHSSGPIAEKHKGSRQKRAEMRGLLTWNGFILLSLALAEVLNILSVQDIRFGRWAAAWVTWSAIVGFVVLASQPIWNLVREIRPGPFRDLAEAASVVRRSEEEHAAWLLRDWADRQRAGVTAGWWLAGLSLGVILSVTTFVIIWLVLP